MGEKLRQWFGGLITTIIGLSWGDEGKGEIVCRLSKLLGVDFVVRWQGGPNAGHTVEVEPGKTIVLQHLPSGIIHPEVRCLLGAGMVIDPLTLLEEIQRVRACNITVDSSRLMIDGRATVIWGLSKRLDAALEEAAGTACIGTTKRGIGPAYAQTALRQNLIIFDLLDANRLRARLDRLIEVALEIFRLEITDREDKEWYEGLLAAGQELAACVGDVGQEVRTRIKNGDVGLAEGAQGTLLDVKFGTVPFVTGSYTLAQSVATGLGVPSRCLDRVVGVIKAYVTRVGNGPFPTKLDNEIGRFLQIEGAEKGSVTGRIRDCGAVDALAARWAVAVNGVTDIYLTKLDILTGLATIPVAIAYKIGGIWLKDFPYDPADLNLIEEVEYEYLSGWPTDISGCRDFWDLPIQAQQYVFRLQELIGVPITFIGVGPGQDQQIVVSEEFSRVA